MPALIELEGEAQERAVHATDDSPSEPGVEGSGTAPPQPVLMRMTSVGLTGRR